MNAITDYAFVLHTYSYRETSVIVDVLTKEHGRMSVIAKGVRSAKSKLKPVLQPFLELEISAKGRSALKNLAFAEIVSSPMFYSEVSLLSALYVNELIVRLLEKEEPCPELYQCYRELLPSLQEKTNIEPSLRLFEKRLLEALGYAIGYTHTADTHQVIDPDKQYQFVVEHGFVEVEKAVKNTLFTGAEITSIQNEIFVEKHVLQAAKRLFRLALQPLLGNKPLKSREIMQGMV